MGYRITIDRANCINCGVCMDVCPVEALDMSRPSEPGVETSPTFGRPLAWMMEFPVQVGECIGCRICVDECPVTVMTLDAPAGPTPLAQRQGPINRPVSPEGWVPLTEVAREVLKPERHSPWGDRLGWSSAPGRPRAGAWNMGRKPAHPRRRRVRRRVRPEPTPGAMSGCSRRAGTTTPTLSRPR